MPDINSARRRFSRALIVLLSIDLLAVVLLVSPIGRSSRSGRARIDQLWSELRTKEREVVPLRGIDGKVVEAKREVQDFYDSRLPSSYAALSEQVGKLAAANRVSIGSARYGSEDTAIAGLERVSIDLAVSGDYLQEIKFINALERDKTFFLVNSVALQQQSLGSGAVRLQLRIETYLKSA